MELAKTGSTVIHHIYSKFLYVVTIVCGNTKSITPGFGCGSVIDRLPGIHGPGFKYKINKTVGIMHTVSKTIVLERTQEIYTIRRSRPHSRA